MSILDQLDANRSEMTQLSAVPGVALAKVTNIQDPDKLDRVRCQLLTKNPEVKETNWAWVMSFMGGKGYGAAFFPDVGDVVVLGLSLIHIFSNSPHKRKACRSVPMHRYA